MKVRVDCVKLL